MRPAPTRHARRRSLVLALGSALLATGAVAPAAGAATVSVTGGTLVYQAAGGETNTPSVSRDSQTQYRVYDSHATMTPGAGCTDTSNQYSLGHEIFCAAAGVAHIRVDTGDLDDSVGVYSSVGTAIDTNITLGAGTDSADDQSGGPSYVEGGDGNDTISTYGGADEIHGGPGKDDISAGDGNDVVYGDAADDYIFGGAGNDDLHGGDGKDSMYGADDDDTMHGDAGDDDMTGNAGTDVLYGDGGNDDLSDDGPYGDPYPGDQLHGGDGVDTADYGYRSSSWDAVTISLDDAADDGAAGENDQVGFGGDVENVTTGWGDDTVTGNDGPNVIKTDFGNDTIDARGGDDVVYGMFGDDVIHGGAGNDTLNGLSDDDKLYGEAGNDQLNGSTGDDTLDAGAGVDTVDGGDDNDVVLAQDGEVDQIGCGIGADVANVDYNDVVNGDPGSLCEAIVRTAAPPATGTTTGGGATTGAGAGGGGTAPATGAGNPNAPLVLALLGGSSFNLKAVVAGGALPVQMQAPGAGLVSVLAQMDAKTAKKAGIAAKRMVSIGRGQKSAKAAGAVTVKVKLTAKARKKLKRLRRTVSVTLVTTFTPLSGKKTTLRRVVKLKR